MGRGKSAVTIEREEYIVDLLKAEKGESVTGSTFDRDLGISAGNRCWLISGLKKRYPQIKNTTPIGSEATYAWIEHVEEEKPMAVPEPTTQTASKKELRNIQPGEVWSTMESNGSKQLVYVISEAINGTVLRITLHNENSNKMGKIGQDYFQINVGKKSYIGDPSRVAPKPVKYFLSKEADADNIKLIEARWMLTRIFGIKVPEPKEIVKEVKVEVPIEKIVEKEVFKDNPDLKIENDYLRNTVKELQEQISELKTKVPEKSEIPDDCVTAAAARLAIVTEERNVWKSVAMKLLDKV